MATNGHENVDVQVITKISDEVDGAINGAKSAATYTVPAIIGGKDVHTSSTFDVISPATGKLLHKCSSVSVEEAIQAVEAAENALPGWKATLPGKRRDIFLKAADILDKRAQELGKYMEDETGSAAFWAGGFNVPVSSDGLRDIAGRISGLVGMIPAIADPDKTALIYREPFGVIMGIAPWYVYNLIHIISPFEPVLIDVRAIYH
jgi:acyl-CoA reductase-like NAD-dependent aldehyde dehydrogenase